MQTLRDFEIEVIRRVSEGVLSSEQLFALAELSEPGEYEYTGAGYYLTVSHPSLPSQAQTLSSPVLEGKAVEAECGFVVMLGNGKLVLECFTWAEAGLPPGFRDQTVVISAPPVVSS